MGAGWSSITAPAPREAEEVVAAIAAAGGEAVAIKADVTVPSDVTAMVDEVERRWGGTGTCSCTTR